MPVVLRLKGYKFWFYQADLSEPPHVHIGKDGKEAKFWLNPVVVAHPGHFSKHELNQIEKIVIKFREHILGIWQQEQEKRENC